MQIFLVVEAFVHDGPAGRGSAGGEITSLGRDMRGGSPQLHLLLTYPFLVLLKFILLSNTIFLVLLIALIFNYCLMLT